MDVRASKAIYSTLRLLTALAWVSLATPPTLTALLHHTCKPFAASTLEFPFTITPLRNSLVLLTKYIPSSYCHVFETAHARIALSPQHTQWLQLFCIFSHIALLISHTIRPRVNPFFALFDAVLLAVAANCFIGGKPQIQSVAAPCLLGVCLVAGVAVVAYQWFPYACDDLAQQKKKLTTAWPRTSTPSRFTSPSSPKSVTSTSDATQSLRLERLSLDTVSPQCSPPCYSAVFSPPTLGNSMVNGNSPYYAASAAPGFGYLRSASPQKSQPEDAMSFFTSVSQLSERRREARRVHKRRGRPRGLLRWSLYLLFGRLETWEDVRAELVCILNAVLVGVLLILIGHMFCSIVPALWAMHK